MTDLRRRLPRQEAHWRGKYTVEGGHAGVWGGCEVLDVSILGAGLELFDDPQELLPDDAADLIGRRLLIEVQTPAGASITLQMVGEVRYGTEGARGGIRVGVAFGPLSPTEHAILNVLEQMLAVW